MHFCAALSSVVGFKPPRWTVVGLMLQISEKSGLAPFSPSTVASREHWQTGDLSRASLEHVRRILPARLVPPSARPVR